MAIRTVSNTGGNWTATTTWVGGVVPLTADTIATTATSGQLTVNTAAAIAGADFTSYVNTLTISTGNTLQINTGNLVLSSTMLLVQAGNIIMNGVCSITSNGNTTMDLLTFLTGTKTLNDNLTIASGGTLTINTGTVAVNGNSINCNGSIATGTSAITGTTTFNFTGSGNIQIYTIANPVVINTSGSYTMTEQAGIGLVANSSITWTSGTITNSNLKMSSQVGTITLNSGSNIWDEISIISSANNNTVLNLTSNLCFKKFFNACISSGGGLAFGKLYTAGPGRLIGGDIYLNPNIVYSGQYILRTAPALYLIPGVTHSFSGIFSMGMGYVSTFNNSSNNMYTRILSSTASTRATIEVTGTQSIMFTDFTDITAVGNTVYTLLGRVTTCTNISPISRYYYTAGGGSSTTGSTFVC